MTEIAVVITENTGIAAGLVVSLIVALISCTVWIVSRINKLDARMARLEEEHYTKAEAAEHSLRLAIENPTMNVPDPRNPGQLIRPRQ